MYIMPYLFIYMLWKKEYSKILMLTSPGFFLLVVSNVMLFVVKNRHGYFRRDKR